MVKFVRKHGLEGIVAKRADSVYQRGLRTGLWCKQRLNRGQEFVVGGYVPSHLGVDSLVVGFYRGKDLYYAARVRPGFIPATRRKVFEAIKHLKTSKCPFVNLPEKEAGRWGQGLTAEKMKDCVWLLCRMRHSSHWTKPLRGIAVGRTVGFRAEACRLSRLVPIDFHTDAPLRKHGCAACSTSPFAQGAPHDKPSPAHD